MVKTHINVSRTVHPFLNQLFQCNHCKILVFGLGWVWVDWNVREFKFLIRSRSCSGRLIQWSGCDMRRVCRVVMRCCRQHWGIQRYCWDLVLRIVQNNNCFASGRSSWREALMTGRGVN